MWQKKRNQLTNYWHSLLLVHWRELGVVLVLELLVDEVGLPEKTKYLDLLKIADMKFRSLTVENDFVWEDQFSSNFPEAQFWYLYRSVTNTGGLR